MAVSVYALADAGKDQLPFFEDDTERDRRLCDAMDRINDRYGEFVITPRSDDGDGEHSP